MAFLFLILLDIIRIYKEPQLRKNDNKMSNINDVIKKLNKSEREYLLDYFKDAPSWLMESFQVLNLPPKTSFIEEGEEAKDIFILLKGNVTAIDYRVEEIVYRHYDFTPVEVFGAMELICEMDYYMTTLMTVKNCILLKCSRAKYEKWLLNDIHAFQIQSATITKYLLKQVRKERLYLLLSGRERLAIVLMRLYEVYAENNSSTIYVSRKEFVETTGLSERTITRILKEMEEKKVIHRKGWEIIISFEQYQEIKKMIDLRILEE